MCESLVSTLLDNELISLLYRIQPFFKVLKTIEARNAKKVFQLAFVYFSRNQIRKVRLGQILVMFDIWHYSKSSDMYEFRFRLPTSRKVYYRDSNEGRNSKLFGICFPEDKGDYIFTDWSEFFTKIKNDFGIDESEVHINIHLDKGDIINFINSGRMIVDHFEYLLNESETEFDGSLGFADFAEVCKSKRVLHDASQIRWYSDVYEEYGNENYNLTNRSHDFRQIKDNINSRC